MKKVGIVVLAVVVLLAMLQSVSLADEKSGCSSCGHSSMSVKEKFFKKIDMIYLYEDELGISEKQLKQVKELKIGFKKDMIATQAEIDAIAVDIKALLYDDSIDVGTINKLIDQKYEIKKAKSKKAVAAYANLKKILTKDQLNTLKEIYHDKKKTCSVHGSYKGSRKH